jgi:glycosyltransferase involved in cell wall biosynthesis
VADEFIIDASPLGGGISGAGRYAYHLIDELVTLEADIPLRIMIPPAENHSWDTNEWSTHDNVRVDTASITGLGPKRHFYYARQRPTCRVHHSLSSYVPIFLNSDRTLVTIHDLKHFKLGDSLEGRNRLKQVYVRRLIARSVRVADHVITVSEHTKSDIVDEFGVSASKVSVIPLGHGGGLVETTGESPFVTPYVLFVGSVRRHKNLEILVDSYQRYRQQSEKDLSLVIAGSKHDSYQPELENRIDDEYRQDIHFLGHVEDEMVARLYKHARAFVYPSLYEGFGLPPLEAMGYGTPVIASNRASIPEVVGDAGEYFDPTDSEELTEVLTAVVEGEELRTRLVKRGNDRYNQFSWKQTARETLKIYSQFWGLE